MNSNLVELNLPEYTRVAGIISKIMAYLGESMSLEAFQWLKTDAIYYPELIEDALHNIDETRFNKGCLSKQERWELFDNIVQTHESFVLIDSVVDDYLLTR